MEWLGFLRIILLLIAGVAFFVLIRRLSRSALSGLALIGTGFGLVLLNLVVGALFHSTVLPPAWRDHWFVTIGFLTGYIGQTLGLILLLLGTYRFIRSLLPHLAEHYSSLVEHSLVGVYLFQGGVFKFVNPRLAEIFGYERNELIGKSIFDLVAPESQAMVAEKIRQRLSGEAASLHFQFTAIRKNGERFEAEVYGSRTIYEARPAIHGTLLDITEQQRAEEALRVSEERFSKVFRSSPDAMTISTLDKGQFIEVNDSFLRLTGYGREEAIGHTAMELNIWVRPEDRDELGDRLRQQGVVRNLEYIFRTKSGDLRVGLLSAEVIELGGESCMLAITKDITERKRAEKVQASIYRISEAAHSAQSLDELFRSIHDIISELMPAKSFYIALYDAETETLSFPYFVDEHDEKPAPKKLGRGVTEYVLRTGEPLLAPPDVFENLASKGEVELIGARSIDWLGVPLKMKERTIGVLVVQSYTEGVTFTEEEKDILMFVSSQVAMAIERKQAETALRESSEKYRDLVENINDVIFTVDEKGVITYISPVIEQISGYRPAEVIGRSFTEFIHPDDLPALRESFRNTMTGQLKPLEYRLLAKTGEVRWVRSSSRRFSGKNPEAGVQGVIRDITERKRAEMLLAGQKRMLEMIARGTRLTDVLEALTRLIEEESEGMLCSILLLDEDGITLRHGAAPSLPESYNRAVDGTVIGPAVGSCGTAAYRKEPVIVEDIARDPLWADYRDLALSHGLRACWSTPILSTEGDVLGTFAMYYREPRSPSSDDWHLIDIATNIAGIAIERQRAEKALKESEERYRDLVQGLDAIVWEGDPQTLRFTFVSQRAEAILGYPVEQWLSQPDFWLDHLHPDDREQTLATCLAATREGRDHEMEYRAIAADGHVVWLRDLVKVVRDAQGQARLKRGLMIDITEHKRIEQELLRAQKLESIGLLAGGIAHDFNNILMGITGNLSLAKMHAKPGSRVFDRLTVAEKAAMKARQLTQQLLTFSKGGAPIKQTTSIVSILKETAEFALRGSNVRCRFSFPDGLWPVDVDIGQMGQVIHNLVINADQAMPEGGLIQVRAENLVVRGEEGLPLDAGRYVKVVIQDQGSGIRPEHLPKIFDPYFTTKQEGNGLGLATAYSIVKRHGGCMTVESELGAGTTFIIYLPASEKEIPVKKEVDEGLIMGQGRILVMDDNEVVRDVTSQMLSTLGYEVVVTQDGADAIEVYKRAMERDEPFDAVILDLTVPGGLGGKGTIRRLLELDPEVKAIVSSGYSNDPIMANYREYGFRGVMAKPYKLQTLSQALHRAMHGDDE